MAPEAGAHSGSLLCQLTGIHTNPPAGFLLLWIQEPEPTPHGEGGPGQGGQVAHPNPAPSTPKPSQGNKRKKEVAYLWRVVFVWFAETRRCP